MAVPVQADFHEDVRRHYRETLEAAGFDVARALQTTKEDEARRGGRWEAHWLAKHWYNARRRRIGISARAVLRSAELSARSLTAEVEKGLSSIEAASIAGSDLRPYLSDRVDDLLWVDRLLNDWGIHHLHLAPKGSRELLYVIAKPDTLYFIDVLDHGAFGERELVQIVHRNWPALLPRSPGMQAISEQPHRSGKTINAFRHVGVNAPVVMDDGTVYVALGGGYVGNGMSSLALQYANAAMTQARLLEDQCRELADQLATEIAAKGVPVPAALHLRLYIDETKCLMQVLEENTRLQVFQSLAKFC